MAAEHRSKGRGSPGATQIQTGGTQVSRIGVDTENATSPAPLEGTLEHRQVVDNRSAQTASNKTGPTVTFQLERPLSNY